MNPCVMCGTDVEGRSHMLRDCDEISKLRAKLDSQRLDFAVEFIEGVVQHCIEGGSFRHFIYNRLRFPPSAYSPLYLAGAMQFTNACPINLDPETAPQFGWAGVATVIEHDEKIVRFRWDEIPAFAKDLESSAEVVSGHAYSVGGPVLVVYYSSAGGGRKLALEVGRDYAAWRLFEENLPEESKQ